MKPFLIVSSVILFMTLGSSLTKNLTFQYTLINLHVVAIINFASCVLFPVPYLMMQLLHAGASIPPEAMMHFPPCFRFLPLFSKNFLTFWKISKILPFPEKISHFHSFF